MGRILLSVSLVLSVVGCDADSAVSPDAGGDNCTQGCEPDAAPVPITPDWSLDHVHGVPNIDDDDGNGQRDFDQPPFAADNDLSTLVLPAADLAIVGADERLELTLAGDTEQIKVYLGNQQILGRQLTGATHTLTPTGGDVELTIEFGDYAVAGTLRIAHLAADGELLGDSEVELQAAPLLMNHHLQPAERVWAVRVNGNQAFINAFETVLGSRFTSVPGSSYGGDVWIQDEFEFATLTGDQGQRLDVIIDSIRNRGIDGYKHQLIGPGTDTIAQTWGIPQHATTFDAFGNLEASPPVRVGGVNYPFGRIYYGREGNFGLHPHLADFLASQRVQAPFELPTDWLCVGHVDEYSSFVPDPSSAKGFKLLLSDVPSALQILNSLPADQSLPLYTNGHGYSTVGAMRSDAHLIALNNSLQADYLDPIRQRFKTELGLTDDDIILVPSLFEVVGRCGGRVAALIPGMVNLTVARVGNTTHVFVPDPFFRHLVDQSTDPFIADFRARMPAGLELHFIDNWYVYHLGLGEVHCGSNVQRTPTANWWNTARHLLGGE